jgi:hypothetical protein
MNTPALIPPDDLFRHYQRGMLDPHSLNTQILLHLIEQAEVQRALMEMLAVSAEDTSKLSLDIEVIASYLHLPRPSQQEPPDSGADENGHPPDAPEDE